MKDEIAMIPPSKNNSQAIGIRKNGSTRVPSSATEEPITSKAMAQPIPASIRAIEKRFMSLTLRQVYLDPQAIAWLTV